MALPPGITKKLLQATSDKTDLNKQALRLSRSFNDAMDELLSKLDVAIDDMEQGRVQPIDDAWKEIDRI